MFGSCQQGMSAMFDKDFHYLIFGAPGAYNWKGSLVMLIVGSSQNCNNMFAKYIMQNFYLTSYYDTLYCSDTWGHCNYLST